MTHATTTDTPTADDAWKLLTALGRQAYAEGMAEPLFIGIGANRCLFVEVSDVSAVRGWAAWLGGDTEREGDVLRTVPPYRDYRWRGWSLHFWARVEG